METINKPTDEEITEYFKYCAKELGYPEDGEMVEIAISSASAMFNGQFDRWKSMTDADHFRKEYERKHQFCPGCGSDHLKTTLVGYIVNMRDKENYKDKNHIECVDCGFKGIRHDLIP